MYNLEHICRLHLCNWCSSTEVNTDAIIREVSLAGTPHSFWVSPQPSERGPIHMSNRGRQRVRVGERERERGKGIYRKMGLRSTFSCKEPFQDQVSVSQFSDRRSAIGFGLRLRLDRLTQDGEPDFQTLSPLLRPSSPQLQTATGSLIENRGIGLDNLQM